MLLGPVPQPPHLGGIANGIMLLRKTPLATVAGMGFFNTYRAPDPSRSAVARVRYQADAYARFLGAVARGRPAIVHVKTAGWVNFYQSAGYCVLARALRRRTVLQIHDGTFPAFFDAAGDAGQRRIRRLLRVPDAVIALSNSWAAYFHDVLGVRRVEVVPNGLPTEHFHHTAPARARWGISADRVVVLFMGTRSAALDEEKGFDDLVTAIARVRTTHPEVLLLVAGGASHDDVLHARLGPAGEGWLTVGVINAEEKPVIYRSADVFALPSRAENMPNTLLEAMAAGCAVVATPVGAVPEILRASDNGLVTPVGDVDALAQQLTRLAADPAMRARLGEAAARRAAEGFDLTVVERGLAALYESLAPGSTRP